MKATENLSIINKTKGRLPSLPFVEMKNKVLGPKYELSLVFVPKKEIHDLNKKYRNVDSPTDILSFPLNENSGEIFICPEITKKKAPDFDRDYESYFSFLFIHGLVHLLGHDHGKKMDKIETRYKKMFGI